MNNLKKLDAKLQINERIKDQDINNINSNAFAD